MNMNVNIKMNMNVNIYQCKKKDDDYSVRNYMVGRT